MILIRFKFDMYKHFDALTKELDIMRYNENVYYWISIKLINDNFSLINIVRSCSIVIKIHKIEYGARIHDIYDTHIYTYSLWSVYSLELNWINFI